MSNITDTSTFEQSVRYRYRAELSRWLGARPFNVGLTLNFNRSTPLSLARKQIGDLFFWVDRRLFGPRFLRRPDIRVQGVFFFEHLETNTHAHGLIEVREEARDKFLCLFPEGENGIWSKIRSGGSHFVSPGTNIGAAANYITKEQRAWSDPDTMLWLSEFHPPEQ